MEIGFLGLDGVPGTKQERLGVCVDDCRVSKMGKTNHADDSNYLMLENSGGFVEKSTFDDDKLRFFCHSMPENSAFPYLQHMASAHTKNAGYYYSGGLSGSSGMYLLSGVRGPFTQSQWHELEQQALIYKYMRENEPIPLHLLIPIVKAFEPSGLFGFNGGSFRPSTSWGMGPFHLGYSRSTDPEPGRCRRTDGKKWRCSRDAVATQKYCERHMNRGRHRSRKHVEPQQNANANANSSSTNKTFALNIQNSNKYQIDAFQDTNRSDQGMKQVDWSGGKYQAQCGEMGIMNGFEDLCPLSSLSQMGAADFMSSTTDLNMGLRVGPMGEAHKWSSIPYGPLGEALQSSNEDN